MCGITGFYSSKQRFNRADLEAMTTALQHRGPDAAGYFVSDDGNVGLGHRRLSIIDLSTAANQPMHSHNNRYVMVFNGEVYNFSEIARKLDISPRTHSDTEIILEAFVRKGPACVHLFNGMFALAIYDKHEQSLFLLRDRLGVKPLYYFHHEEEIAFASEIKALLQAPVVRQKTEMFPSAIYSFLYAGYIPEPYTVYNKVSKLPAGSYAVIKNGQLTITPYWLPQQKITAEVQTNYAAAKKQLDELLTTAVQYRMISDVPFGTFLSGGVDSSTVTAIAQKISDKPVNTFSIGYKEDKFNESDYARAVAKKLGTNHHELIVTQQDAIALVERMMDSHDQPYADTSAIPTMLVSKLARRYVTMTLSGDGGDELFMGYGMYNWARRMQNPLLRTFRKPIGVALGAVSARARRAGKVVNYYSKERIKSHIFSQEQYFFSEAELQHVLTPAYLHTPLFNENAGPIARKLSEAEEQALYDIRYYLKDDLLIKVDVASMQFSLETRTPFLDYRVVEFALNLSENLKVQQGVSKYLLKEVLYGYLPKEMFERPKWGFSVPLTKWLRNDLHYLIEKYLNKQALEDAGIVNVAYVMQLVKKFETGEDQLYNRVWALISLHKWVKEHGR